MTACGGNFIGGEISRNEQSPLWGVATIEAAELGARSPQRTPLIKTNQEILRAFQMLTTE